MLIGCFNITLYSYFDMHSIFDLMTFSMWDFMLWWFDVDFMLFDFNFDLMLCLSFLFIFLLHFFIKLMFSFLMNFMNINVLHKNCMYKNYMSIMYFNMVYFLNYFFMVGLQCMLWALDLYALTYTCMYMDFNTFSDVSKLYTVKNNMTYMTPYLFLLFYFNISMMHFLWFLMLKFFFSQSYYTSGADTHMNNKLMDLKNLNIMQLMLIDYMYIMNVFNNVYYYYLMLNINILFLVSLMHLFYMYNAIEFNKDLMLFYMLTYKLMKTMYTLNVCYTLEFYRHTYSNMSMMLLLVYTMFLINFFGLFVKDFIHMVMNINMNTMNFLYEFNAYNFNNYVYMNNKKQLQFMMYN